MKKILLVQIILFASAYTFGQNVIHEWTIGQGGTGDDKGQSITVDNSNNLLIAGLFRDTIDTVNPNVDFDPGPEAFNLSSIDEPAVFIQKLNNNGDLIWAKQIGESSTISVSKVLADAVGNVITIGTFEGIVDFDPGAGIETINASENRAFILKLDSNGDFLWVKSFECLSSSLSSDLDFNGDIYTIGLFDGTVDFDPSSSTVNLTSTGQFFTTFIHKLDSDGNFVWVKEIGGSDNIGDDIKLGETGNIFILGDFNDPIDIDPGPEVETLTPISETGGDIYILKLNPDGEFEWAKQIGNTSGVSMYVDASENIYSVGAFHQTTDFDPGSETYNLTAGYYHDSFILKLNNLGEFQWAKQILSEELEYLISIRADFFGNVYTIGTFNGTVDVNPGLGIDELSSFGSFDYYIQKLNSQGDFIWAKHIGGENSDKVTSFSLDNNNNIITTGHYKDTINVDPEYSSEELYSNGEDDIFIQKFWQNNCSNFGVSFSSAINVTCVEEGFVSCFAFGGIEPYSYVWDTNPVVEDSLLSNIESGGFYIVTVTDDIGCEINSTILIDGPVINGFDMDANLVNESFRPGYNSSLNIDAYNNGCIPAEGSITLVLDSLINYIYSDIEPDIMNGDTLVWNYEETTYSLEHILLNSEVNTSSNAIIGDTVCFELSISPISGDADSTNNIKHYCFPIENGYDPNDKKVYPQGICDGHFVLKTDPLTYTIRFQNTGNAEAINIHIMDSLSSYLDINTVEILGSSHDMYTVIRPDNVLDFMFDDIWLPDSTNNEPESHGYVIYKVYPNSFIYNGTYVDNKAEIYFDFNPPIVTNTVFNTLVNVLLSCDINMGVDEDHSLVNDVLIYPNPSIGAITVDFGMLQEVGLNMYNLNGQLIYSQQKIMTDTHQFEVDEPAGIYILEISSTKDKQYYKVVLK